MEPKIQEQASRSLLQWEKDGRGGFVGTLVEEPDIPLCYLVETQPDGHQAEQFERAGQSGPFYAVMGLFSRYQPPDHPTVLPLGESKLQAEKELKEWVHRFFYRMMKEYFHA